MIRRPTTDELALVELHHAWLHASEELQHYFLEWTQSQQCKEVYKKIQNVKRGDAKGHEQV